METGRIRPSGLLLGTEFKCPRWGVRVGGYREEGTNPALGSPQLRSPAGKAGAAAAFLGLVLWGRCPSRGHKVALQPCRSPPEPAGPQDGDEAAPGPLYCPRLLLSDTLAGLGDMFLLFPTPTCGGDPPGFPSLGGLRPGLRSRQGQPLCSLFQGL